MAEEKVTCRTPAEGRNGVTNIPRWKYDLVRGHLLNIVRYAGPEGAPFASLKDALAARLTDAEIARLGSPGWHVTVVKLNMEVEGALARAPGPGPQRVILAGG